MAELTKHKQKKKLNLEIYQMEDLRNSRTAVMKIIKRKLGSYKHQLFALKIANGKVVNNINQAFDSCSHCTIVSNSLTGSSPHSN